MKTTFVVGNMTPEQSAAKLRDEMAELCQRWIDSARQRATGVKIARDSARYAGEISAYIHVRQFLIDLEVSQ